MLGEMIADHREPVGVTVAYVEDSGAGSTGCAGSAALDCGSAVGRVLAFYLVRPSAWIAVLPGAVFCFGLSRPTVPHRFGVRTLHHPFVWQRELRCKRVGLVGLVSLPQSFERRRASPEYRFPRPGGHLGNWLGYGREASVQTVLVWASEVSHNLDTECALGDDREPQAKVPTPHLSVLRRLTRRNEECPQLLTEHRDLYQAVASGDPERARARALAHVPRISRRRSGISSGRTPAKRDGPACGAGTVSGDNQC